QRDWLDIAISLVQPLGIIIGGCWIAFLYFTYQEKDDVATLTEKQLSIQQAEITLKTQEVSNKLDVDLKKLTLDQVRISSEIQKSERELKYAQLRTEVELRKQEVAMNQLKQRQEEHDVQYSTAYRSSYDMVVRAIKLREVGAGVNEYKVSLFFSLKNESTVPYEVSFVATEAYVGFPKTLDENIKGVSFTALGTPPSIVNGQANSGNLAWYPLMPPQSAVWGEAVGEMG